VGKKRNRTVRLTDRDRRILQHVERQRMTTVEAVQALFFPENERDAAKSTLRRLYGTPPDYRYLRPEPLDARRVFYRLTPQGARLIGAGKDAARPLGLQARVERYALLWFFCMDCPQRRSPFHPRKFPDQFHFHKERLPRQTFYVEEDEAGEIRLGYVLVDHRSDSRRLVRKAGQTLQRFLRRGWFDDFVRAGAFGLTVLTTTEEKRKSLERALRRKLPGFLLPHLEQLELATANPLPVIVTVTVVPGLSDILPGTAGEGSET
jgi:DNA-binding MarR family transcriptional regulator